ncbi:Hypothetical protein CAP_7706 [Chondromyces apiculatus DSM 436]|uniref:Uncharacterized protein n=1 Tax=Chondromyces apiculatus DSM 436 TaxID=1192034 RepID=A0A017SY99_9BACT|nr:Hypothetical protein CAP_7706 [Chondromyces apiculatus DSM 436]
MRARGKTDRESVNSHGISCKAPWFSGSCRRAPPRRWPPRDVFENCSRQASAITSSALQRGPRRILCPHMKTAGPACNTRGGIHHRPVRRFLVVSSRTQAPLHVLVLRPSPAPAACVTVTQLARLRRNSRRLCANAATSSDPTRP